MQVLLDTQSFLWWIEDNPQLSSLGRKTIEDSSNEVFFSAASAWEIATKAQLGKLKLPNSPEAFISQQLQQNDFVPLSISVSHALHIASLPAIHRDPFDRILIAQCQLEQMVIVTSDPVIRQYKVATIW